jgi:hypothetical protein
MFIGRFSSFKVQDNKDDAEMANTGTAIKDKGFSILINIILKKATALIQMQNIFQAYASRHPGIT